MYKRSPLDSYYTFRTFMMGTKGTSVFPKGIIYEAVSNEYRELRGASAAMDLTMPLLDSFLGIFDFFPENSLTSLLKDYRQYIP